MIRSVFTAKWQVPSSLKKIVRYSHTEVKIPVPWGHVAGKWWNKNEGEPIIALHGWLDNANSFDTLIPNMKSKFPVLALDIPGHGMSSHFPKGVPYHRMSSITVLKHIVNYFGWKKVSFLGHSFGGQTCFLYAAMYPDQVDAIVTLDILLPVPLNEKRLIEKGGQTIDDLIRRDSQKFENAPLYPFEKLVEMVTKSHVAPVSENAAKILLQRGTVKIGEDKYRLTYDPKLKGFPISGWSSRELLQFCKNLKTNILCIKAKSSPYFCTKEFFDESWAQISKVAKHADLLYVEGGHHVHLQDGEVIAPIVNEFLTKHLRKI